MWSVQDPMLNWFELQITSIYINPWIEWMFSKVLKSLVCEMLSPNLLYGWHLTPDENLWIAVYARLTHSWRMSGVNGVTHKIYHKTARAFPKFHGHLKSMNKLTLNEPAIICHFTSSGSILLSDIATNGTVIERTAVPEDFIF